ncbi:MULTISPECIES: NUDIX hydrolase [unclassified Sphingobium]|uniref:NUDIX hydrolase n=1 Tax=unclassified Sphingobium TaxID=2611147 RepID=UPI00119B82F3|nr:MULTISPECIES: NUDIX domain-containing protein [unclassified Sphingobium]MBG6120144.1 8-oxo-dGTP pyrophosphatase MutT (NUDIX family) [Sphingobium sp. JAI105]TWD05655.1 NUDIX domain-containing protein [Sphingobium sp. AEW010]TWD23208.1 NUDIX domain-containing protein [Sphingobium sp. AEW013]TWD25068.1 NUDIX domain-containing protein [Sphingobium sp. AEW001]
MTEAHIPATPRPAATLLLLREAPLEVLMVRRNSRGTFASALVFPGGVLSDEDGADAWRGLIDWSGADGAERDLRIAALRETFEETGILAILDADGAVTTFQPDTANAPFINVVRASGGVLPLDRLVHFAHWITPEKAPKRFDTHFYLLAAPDCDHACSDGAETVALEWRGPRDVLDAEPALPFATRLNLTRLAESDSLAHALEAASARPRFTVLPQFVQREDGAFVCIPAEAGYGITETARTGTLPG